jgi:hypothetical protein
MKVYQLIAELKRLEQKGFADATIRGPIKSTRGTDYNNFQPIEGLAIFEEAKETSVIFRFNNCMKEEG